MLADPSKPAKKKSEEKWKAGLDKESAVRGSDVVIHGEGDPTKALSSSNRVQRYPLAVTRDSPEYQKTVEHMVRHRVGRKGGTGDQVIAAEAFFAATTDGQPATLKTADDAMVTGLMRAHGIDPQRRSNLIKDGFTFIAEVNGRKLKVEYWEGVESPAGGSTAPAPTPSVAPTGHS